MKRPLLFLTLVLAGALLAAVPAPAQSRLDPSFTLVNRSASAVRQVFVTPSGDANWGQNRLARGAAIPPGGSFPVRRRADGNCVLDIRVVFADRQVEERRSLNTCTLDVVTVGGSAQLHAKTGDDPSFRLINRGTVTLREIFVTPAGVPHRGENRLTAAGLPAGTATVIEMPRTGQCFYDLRAVFADHRTLEQRHQNLCRTTDVPVP